MAPPAPPGCWLAGAQSRRSLTGTVEGVGNRGTTDEGPATATASLASAAEITSGPKSAKMVVQMPNWAKTVQRKTSQNAPFVRFLFLDD